MSSGARDDGQRLALFDDRSFFEKALVYGVQAGIIGRQQIASIRNDAPKGLVQIAEFFGTQYLRQNIEDARLRIVNLVSLFLDDRCGGDLDKAARSLRDHSFLSHSRGGSQLLKDLWAMPEDTSIGIMLKSPQKAFLAEWSLRGTPDAYRKTLEQRRAHQRTVSAALWFAGVLGVERSTIATTAAESIIRTGLLLCLSGSKNLTLPTPSSFLDLLQAIRKRGLPAKGQKRLAMLLAELPEDHRTITQRERDHMENFDLAKIRDIGWPMNRLIEDLLPRYFLRDFGLDDVSLVDAAASQDWHKSTGGKTDDHSLLTVFLCLAAGVAAKPVLNKAAARAAIRKIRTEGRLQSGAVVGFIKDLAPYEMQDDLEALWNEFLPDAETYLLDAADTTLIEALDFLKDHCVVI